MSKVKLTKTVIDSAKPGAKDYEIRDTIIPGLLLKVTPPGRKVFMLCYVAASAQRRKPAIGRFGEITVGTRLRRDASEKADFECA
jgi:hypothetical protein